MTPEAGWNLVDEASGAAHPWRPPEQAECRPSAVTTIRDPWSSVS